MGLTANATSTSSGTSRAIATSTPAASDEVAQRAEALLDLALDACRELTPEREQPIPRQQQVPLTVVVPVYNERETLPQILARIDQALPADTQTIIVDDGSDDGTQTWLAELPDRSNRIVILCDTNQGKGAAVRLGIRHSTGAIVAIQDADSEYDPADLLAIIEPIRQGDAETVFGSRYLERDRDPSWIHRFGNWVLTAASNCMTGQRLTDMETCHKAFAGD